MTNEKLPPAHSHGHEHSHGHAHDHGHDHHHHGHRYTGNYNFAFGVGIALNLAFVAIEFFYGFVANSLALMADAGHNLSDVLGLVISWIAFYLAKKPRSKKFSYGLRSSTILSALFNSCTLLVAVGALSWEAIGRFFNPVVSTGSTMSWVAGIGIVVNGLTAMMFFRDRHHDLNIRGAYLHMAADAAVSATVLVGGLVIAKTQIAWVDPLLSIGICVVILWSTLRLLYEAVLLSLHSVPASIDIEKIQNFLQNYPGVSQVHDLHVWGLSTTEVALSSHLVFPKGYPGDSALDEISHALAHEYKINHVTIQIETKEQDHGCALD